MQPTISISPRKATVALTVVVLCLTLASVAGQLLKYFFGYERVVWRFYLDGEGNIPAWYSSAALLLCVVLLATIASAKNKRTDRHARHWKVLSVIFFCLSLDEAFMIHEMAIRPLQLALETQGFLLYAWIIPGAILTVIFFLTYLGFLAALPTKIRWLFLSAGALFVGGAIGVEAASGAYADVHGEANFTYAMIITVEELFEMLAWSSSSMRCCRI